MGLIKAIGGSIGGTLHDQWLDAIRCEDMGNEVLLKKKKPKNGSENIISRGSRIIVNPGQAALIVDNGVIVDACAEPGAYQFDKSSSATVMYGGDFGGMFKEMWERFKYGGGIAKEQAVYFINLKEILDNRFGTPAPIPFSDWGHPSVNPRTNSFYGMSVKIKVFGKYTFKITNPFHFINVIGGNAEEVLKETLTEQIATEVLSSFRNTLAELGSEQYKIPALDLPHKDDDIVGLMREKNYDSAISQRGISIVTLSVEGITFDSDSQKKIDQYELSDEYSKSAYLAHSQGEALKNAAANPAGGGNTLLGMGIGFGAAGINPMQQMQANNAQQSQNFAAFEKKAAEANENAKEEKKSPSNEWICSCGKANTGRFCSECGNKKPESDTWLCSCGTENSGNFCTNCGKKKTAGTWHCSCGEENNGNFCKACGAKKP